MTNIVTLWIVLLPKCDWGVNSMVLQKTSTKSYISQKHKNRNPWVSTFMKKLELTSEDPYIRALG